MKLKVSQLKPLAGYILVEPAKQETKTKSGIYLPEDAEDKPQHGKVLACGAATHVDGVKVSCPVKKGDQVIYKKWGGNDVKLDEVEYQFLKFDDVLAVIK
ncbi:MAG: co-chaperone GroES [Candidatus Pacebacteria bacterium]|nr:co-chaperone GroES [Candidatus Paceibacterota bacterium]